MTPKFEIEVRFKISVTMLSRMNAICTVEELSQSEFGRRAFMEFIKKHEADLVSSNRFCDETDD